jgi:putative Mn2+ efflux pump MntP
VTVKREALVLVALVLAVDAVFIALYFGAGIERAADRVKIAFTLVWTVITLAVVIRGLTRIRSARVSGAGDS